MAERIYTNKVRIDSVEIKIALWEIMGLYDQADGLRRFFYGQLDDDRITEYKKHYRKYA